MRDTSMKNLLIHKSARFLPMVVLCAAACTNGERHGQGEDLYDDARRLYLEERYDEALCIAETGVDENPGNLSWICLYARLLLLTGRPRFAEGVIREGLEIRTEDCELLLLLGRAAYALGDTASALRLLDGAADTTVLEEVYLEKARIFLDFGEEEKAEAAVRKALLLRGLE